MRIALLVEYFRRLPQREHKEGAKSWAVRLQEGMAEFKQQVAARYTEGTLQRLLTHPAVEVRQAAVLALGLVGSMTVNQALAACLHDVDREVRRLASEALWALWFRAESEAALLELQRLMRQRDPQKALDGFATLLAQTPTFAEAYNQRAILYFRLEQYQDSIADCERVLKLNPCHFGAQAGLGQCYLKLNKLQAALRSFRKALRINPNLEGVRETIRSLEEALGGEGKTEDK